MTQTIPPSFRGIPLRVLIVEDEPPHAELLIAELRRAGFTVEWRRVDTEPAYVEELQRFRPDLILSDSALSRFGGDRALELLRLQDADIPFIVVSGTMGEDTAVVMMRHGAADYLLKDRLARLGPAVDRALSAWRLRRQQRETDERLRLSEARFREVFEQVPIGLYRTAHDGRVVDANAALVEMLGYTGRDGILAASARDWYADQGDRDRWLTQIEHDGVVRGYEARMARQDGRVIWTRDTARAVRGPDGVTKYYDGAIEDFTAHRAAEEGVQRQLSRLAGLRAIDNAITASLDLRVTLSVLLDQVAAQLGADAADVLLYDAAAQTLTRAAARGLPPRRASSAGDAPSPAPHGLAARAASESRVVVVSDAAADPAARAGEPALREGGFAAYIAAPLVAKGQVKGVLEVLRRRRFVPGEEWLEFLDTLAGQAAIAIDNAALFGDLQRSNTDLVRAYDTTLEGWVRALDLRDKETEGHSLRVTEATVLLARSLGVDGAELVHVRRGALLHDVGKMAIPDAILLKPGPLTPEEWAVMHRHPEYANELLTPIEYLRPARIIPYCHHEKWDGTGYPNGLQRTSVPLAARIFAVVDVWDALRSDRPYRAAWPAERVREYIRAQAGLHFDPALIEPALATLDDGS
jgi:PAS domain S-box-containing protein/putative nucleotidyltransferase with HDIG domain